MHMQAEGRGARGSNKPAVSALHVGDRREARACAALLRSAAVGEPPACLPCGCATILLTMIDGSPALPFDLLSCFASSRTLIEKQEAPSAW